MTLILVKCENLPTSASNEESGTTSSTASTGTTGTSGTGSTGSAGTTSSSTVDKITSLAASSGHGYVKLTWVNPSSNFSGVTILRKTGSYSTSNTDGTQVYMAAGTNYVDNGLTNGTTYYYSAYAYNSLNYYAEAVQVSKSPAAFSLASSASDNGFNHTATIPAEFKDSFGAQCTGSNNFPKITWQNAPSGTVEFVLIVEDATSGNWVHLNLFGINSTRTEIPRVTGSGNQPNLSAYGSVGENSWAGTAFGNTHTSGYAGPCPPNGTGVHNYYFKIYAMNSHVTSMNKVNRSTFDTNYAAGIIASAEIYGTSSF